MQLPCQEPHKTLPPTSPLMSYGISKSYRPYLYKASRAATSLYPLGPHLQQAHHHLTQMPTPASNLASPTPGLSLPIQPPYYGQDKFGHMLCLLKYPSVTFLCLSHILQLYPTTRSSLRAPCSPPPLWRKLLPLPGVLSVPSTIFIPLIHICITALPLETPSCPPSLVSSFQEPSEQLVLTLIKAFPMLPSLL